MVTRNFEDQKAPSAATVFWAWANDVYARRGVADSLISAQDSAGLNVNIVLWICWTATKFEDIPDPVMRSAIEAVDEWHSNVTTLLRKARRGAKPFEKQSGFEKAAALRESVKGIELDAERIEIDILEDLATRLLKPSPKDDAKSRARRGLAQYAALAGADTREDFSSGLLHRVIDHIFETPRPAPRIGQERDAS